MNWQELIKHLLREFRISETELGSRTKLTQTTINRIKSGATSKPNEATIGMIEKGLNIRIDDSDLNNITYKIIPTSDQFERVNLTNKIPILKTIVHGGKSLNYITQDQIEGYYYAYGLDNRKNVYALKVEGDSMLPTIAPNDLILVDMDAQINNNSIVVVRTKKGEQYIKRYKALTNGIALLMSDNSNYDPIALTEKDIEVIHKVIQIVHYLP